MRLRFLILFYFLPLLVFSQYINIGARSAALGRSDITHPDVWATASNQAALPFSDKTLGIGINYENYYFLKELSLKSLAIFYNSSKFGTFDFLINSFGFSKYRENFFSFGYSMKLASFLAAGVQISYVHFFLPAPYSNLNLFVGEISLFSRLTDDISVGFHLYNPWLQKIKISQSEYYPTVFQLGMSYKHWEKLIFNLTFEKDLENPIFLKTGLEYQIIKNLFLRTGAQLSQNNYFMSFGVGYIFKVLHFDLGFEKHPILGFRSSASISVYF